MVHRVKQGGLIRYAISTGGVWLPGAYPNKRTARAAFRLPYEMLRRLWSETPPGGVITRKRLREAEGR